MTRAFSLLAGVGVAILFCAGPPPFAARPLRPAADSAPAQVFPLNTTDGLRLIGVQATTATYKGHKAVRLIEEDNYNGETLAVLEASDLENGAIELELSGSPRAGSPEGSRGFVGVAFRVQPEALKYEYFYIRPTNGRADDQLRRNHAAQYASEPDYPWDRLRRENPGVYESYADMLPGEWIKVKIVVNGIKAALYLNGADQPCLIVNDLKLGASRGKIGLWIGQGTEAYFTNLKVTQTKK